MTYPNAADGVKKMFKAQLIEILGTVFLALVAIFTIMLSSSEKAGAANDADSFLAVMMIVSIVAFSGLMIVAAVMHLIGLVRAGRDERAFRTALFAVFINLIFIVTGMIFSGLKNGTVSSLMNLFSTIMDMIAFIFVIQGIRNLAIELGNDKLDRMGDNIFKIILAVLVLEFIANIIVLIFGGHTSGIVAGVVYLIAAILSFVQYIIYLIFLARGVKMLTKS